MTYAIRAEPAPVAVTAQPALRRLRLAAFRNYATLDLAVDGRSVVLYGGNGAGKTNLLEAVSLLAPGRGLRRARREDLRLDGAAHPWRVEAEIEGRDGLVDLATGEDPRSERRWLEIMGSAQRGLAALGEHLAITWLTPAMDRLFLDATSERRRFLDRLVLAVYPDHARQLALFERAMRERSIVLRGGPRDPAWLTVLESRMAAAGVAIAAARRDLARGLADILAAPEPPLPAVRLTVAGEIEDWLAGATALDTEQRLAAALAGARDRDQESGGASFGPHRSDLLAFDLAGDEPAARLSTGRQKAMLLAIVLAEAQLRQSVEGDLPILLLDETAAHLDAERRDGLCEQLAAMGGQVFLSGTDRHLFRALEGRALFLHVDRGRIEPDD